MGTCKKLVTERGPHQTMTKANYDDSTLGLFNRHPLSLRDRRRWMDLLPQVPRRRRLRGTIGGRS
jgi:hypothetical protein